MALHIRDFRASDAAGLSGLGARGRLLGHPPAPEVTSRILCGLRGDRVAAAIWMIPAGRTGIVPALQLAAGDAGRSEACEMLAEACLWLTARGASMIELSFIPEDGALLACLAEMNFRPDLVTSVLRRPVPAPSAV